MGAGASAAEGRVFCHHCGARTVAGASGQAPTCGACGAADNVEITDARLPVTSPSQWSPTGSSHGSSEVPLNASIGSLLNGDVLGGVPSESGRGVSRVESVTVVAMQRPENGGLLLRVLPNVVTRDESVTRVAPGSTMARDDFLGGADESAATMGPMMSEEWEVPAEPACLAFISRLKAEPLSSANYGMTCVICSEDVVGEAVELDCGHAFHEDCVRRWLTRQHTCPICRLNVEVDDATYLRSIGLEKEADAVEHLEQERQAHEEEKQAAERRRWVESMRRGEPVHFGLTCGHCAESPLTGVCYRCSGCESFVLCGECNAAWEPRGASCGVGTLSKGDGTAGSGSGTGSSEQCEKDSCFGRLSRHPEGHVLVPFGSPESFGNGASPSFGGVSSAGLLTVFVPGPTQRLPPHGVSEAGDEVPRAATALAAAEVAAAAVRSLALAPLSAPLVTGSGSDRRTHPVSASNRNRSGRRE